MLKLLVVLGILFGVALSEGQEWTNWNYLAANSPNSVAYQEPSLPSQLYSRYQNSTYYNSRQNQYRYLYNKPGFFTCNIYCGLRAFLTSDSNGNIYCQRDMSSNFWGAYGGTYPQNCIPDVDKNIACYQANSYLATVGTCNAVLYANTPYSGM